MNQIYGPNFNPRVYWGPTVDVNAANYFASLDTYTTVSGLTVTKTPSVYPGPGDLTKWPFKGQFIRVPRIVNIWDISDTNTRSGLINFSALATSLNSTYGEKVFWVNYNQPSLAPIPAAHRFLLYLTPMKVNADAKDFFGVDVLNIIIYWGQDFPDDGYFFINEIATAGTPTTSCVPIPTGGFTAEYNADKAIFKNSQPFFSRNTTWVYFKKYVTLTNFAFEDGDNPIGPSGLYSGTSYVCGGQSYTYMGSYDPIGIPPTTPYLVNILAKQQIPGQLQTMCSDLAAYGFTYKGIFDPKDGSTDFNTLKDAIKAYFNLH